ncbi:hypothetical protein FDZ71_06070 [bacterium]|nr:MAG: hypothetical protein FDZ71_06070 [bacterium]
MLAIYTHVHLFIEAGPAYSPAQVVQILKSISAREVDCTPMTGQIRLGEPGGVGHYPPE